MKSIKIIVISILLVSCLTLGGLFAWLALLNTHGEKELLGSWQMQETLDGKYARNAAREWLSGAEMGEQVEIANYIDNPKVSIILTFREDGSWEKRLEKESYEKAEENARKGLGSAFYKLLALRAAKTGHDGFSQEDASQLMQEATGMNAEEYFSETGLQLLPPLDELQSFYDSAGTYAVEKEELIWNNESRYHFLVDDDMLVIYSDDNQNFYEVYKKYASE